MSSVVLDGGNLLDLADFGHSDCSIDAALVHGLLHQPEYADLMAEAVALGAEEPEEQPEWVARRWSVLIGTALAARIPGRVFVEVDADLAFDSQAIFARAHEILRHFAEQGLAADRIVMTFAANWEGIAAAAALQKAGIDCNLSLVTSLVQAMAAADAGAFMITTCLGPISDWCATYGDRRPVPGQDPGVAVLRRIHEFYRSHRIPTLVSASTFGSVARIEAVAGCDRLLIAPALLARLAADHGPLVRRLGPCTHDRTERQERDEPRFRWDINDDAMTTEILATGIRALGRNLAALQGAAARELQDRANSGARRGTAPIFRQAGQRHVWPVTY